MECITVQKDSNVLAVDYPAVVYSNQCMVESGSRRFCSRNGLVGISGILLVVLLLLSLACQLAQWKNDAMFTSELSKLKVELKTFKSELTHAKDEINYIKAENEIIKKELSDGEAALAIVKDELTLVHTKFELVKEILTNGTSEDLEHQRVHYKTQDERQRKAGAKSRHGRQAPSGGCVSMPHFYMKGKGKEDIQDNRFLWDGADGIDQSGNGPFVPRKDSMRDRSAVAAVQIGVSGVYYIYIQIKVHGRRNVVTHPGVGFSLHRNATQTLSQAILTQDEKGLRYGGSARERPVDTLTLSGIFYLQREDILYVTPLADQINDHTIQYVNEADSAHFGGFMLEMTGCHA